MIHSDLKRLIRVITPIVMGLLCVLTLTVYASPASKPAAQEGTETATAIVTETITATMVATATTVSTSTPILTPTATATLTPTVTALPTATPTLSPTLTATSTPILTPTAPATLTPTLTATTTPLLTPTLTVTPTATATLTPTVTVTPTATATLTPTVSPGQLDLTMAIEPAFVTAGDFVTVTLSLSNAVQSKLDNLVISTTLPVEINYQTALGSPAPSYNPILRLLTWQIPPDMASQASSKVGFVAQISPDAPAAAVALKVEASSPSLRQPVSAQGSMIVIAPATPSRVQAGPPAKLPG